MVRRKRQAVRWNMEGGGEPRRGWRREAFPVPEEQKRRPSGELDGKGMPTGRRLRPWS